MNRNGRSSQNGIGEHIDNHMRGEPWTLQSRHQCLGNLSLHIDSVLNLSDSWIEVTTEEECLGDEEESCDTEGINKDDGPKSSPVT